MYYVIEVQTSTTGAVIPFTFDNRQDAEAKYHSLLSVAATSSVPKHGAIMFDENLFIVNQEVYKHGKNVEA